MTRKEYVAFTVNCLKRNAMLFARETDPDMKEFFAERINQNQCELVKCGFTWEEVEEIEMKAYQTV